MALKSSKNFTDLRVENLVEPGTRRSATKAHETIALDTQRGKLDVLRELKQDFLAECREPDTPYHRLELAVYKRVIERKTTYLSRYEAQAILAAVGPADLSLVDVLRILQKIARAARTCGLSMKTPRWQREPYCVVMPTEKREAETAIGGSPKRVTHTVALPLFPVSAPVVAEEEPETPMASREDPETPIAAREEPEATIVVKIEPEVVLPSFRKSEPDVSPSRQRYSATVDEIEDDIVWLWNKTKSISDLIMVFEMYWPQFNRFRTQYVRTFKDVRVVFLMHALCCSDATATPPQKGMIRHVMSILARNRLGLDSMVNPDGVSSEKTQAIHAILAYDAAKSVFFHAINGMWRAIHGRNSNVNNELYSMAEKFVFVYRTRAIN